VDNHDLFQNQWNNRKRFYKKCNYKIIGSDSLQYDGRNTKWKTIYEPNDKNKGDDEDKPPPPKCLIDTSIFANLKED
jgi:hypothetical protein